MTVKIEALQVENFKRLKQLAVETGNSALFILGGKCGQGKTSGLDAITYALGGERYRPTNAQREGSLASLEIRLTLSNGFVVERKGKNSTLKVTDPSGRTGGQQLIAPFVHQFALDLPKFLHSSSKEKAATLLQIIGVGDQLAKLELEEEKKYNERHAFGRIADQKQKFADELPEHPDAPETPITASKLIQEQQAILAKNGENQRKREQLNSKINELAKCDNRIDELKRQLEQEMQSRTILCDDISIARKTVEQLQDESTAEIEKSLREIDEINVKVRANLDKAKANADASECKKQYDALTSELEKIRADKSALLDGAKLPLPGLTVEKGELLYNGRAWDCMGGAEQLRVATAIVRHLNPECGFVLLDKLEQMDLETLEEFGRWLESENLQAIATRVSTGAECSVIIEDGIAGIIDKTPKPTWTAGEF